MKETVKMNLICICAVLLVSLVTGCFYVISDPGREFLIVCGLMALSVVLCFCLRGMLQPVGAAVLGILLISLLLHADYILCTPTWVRQHDVIGFGAGFGQAAFIEYFYEKIRLIDFDPRTLWGFFQPPLHHMLAGLWLRLQVALGFHYAHACENVQVLTMIYCGLMTLYGYLILRRLKVEGSALVLGFSLIALHPCFVLMSGSVNNDMLCTLLTVMTIYYFLGWMESRRLKDLILTALCLGLSMMAKLSGILTAPAIGIILLLVLIRTIRERDAGRLRTLVLHYALFGLISIPLGIWSPVRNFVKFSVPLNYTPEVGEPLEGHSILSRIIDVRTDTPFTRMISSGADFDEFNVPLAFLKTAFFGEYDFTDVSKYARLCGWVILLCGAFLAVCSLALLLRRGAALLSKKSSAPDTDLFFLVLSVTALVFYLNLCFSIPNFSSQDFRYIAFLVVAQAVLLGQWDMENGRGRVPTLAVRAAAALFALGTTGLYLLVGRVIWK